MWTEQSEDTEQIIEYGRPCVQKGMQHCLDQEREDRNTQEFHHLSSETIQVNKVMKQKSKSTER